MSSVNKIELENTQINVKVKLAGLWVALMLLFIYGDFFSLMIPGRIMGLNEGSMGLGTTTPMKLLMVSILMAIPALMVSISLTNKAKLIRILNFIFGTFYALVMILTIASSISEWRIFYIFLGVLEIGVAIIIVWHAWKWPKQSQMT